MYERRQCVRWSANEQITVNLVGSEMPKVCKIEDISYKGLKINASQELKKDENLVLAILLGDELSLNAEATVAWNCGNTCGLCFTKIKDQDKEKIFKFINKSYKEQMKQHLWEGIN